MICVADKITRAGAQNLVAVWWSNPPKGMETTVLLVLASSCTTSYNRIQSFPIPQLQVSPELAASASTATVLAYILVKHTEHSVAQGSARS